MRRGGIELTMRPCLTKEPSNLECRTDRFISDAPYEADIGPFGERPPMADFLLFALAVRLPAFDIS